MAAGNQSRKTRGCLLSCMKERTTSMVELYTFKAHPQYTPPLAGLCILNLSKQHLWGTFHWNPQRLIFISYNSTQRVHVVEETCHGFSQGRAEQAGRDQASQVCLSLCDICILVSDRVAWRQVFIVFLILFPRILSHIGREHQTHLSSCFAAL